MMNADILSKICSLVYAKFPEVNGVKPKVQNQSTAGASNHLIVFTGSAIAANGKVLSRVVRVVVSESGKILKMTTSK